MKFLFVKIILFVLPSIVNAQIGLSYEKDFKLFDGKSYKVYSTSDSLVNEEFLYQVKALDLSNLNASVPSWLFTMDCLVYLNLRNKGLDYLPKEICNFKQLKVLIISENHFVGIPECLFNMHSLEALTMIGCNLDSVSTQFANLKNLKIFAIGGNNYTRDDINFIKEKLPNCRIIETVD